MILNFFFLDSLTYKRKVMKKEKQNITYNVFYFDGEGELIDQTQIDECSKAFAWRLFKEFGHIRKRAFKVELIQLNSN